MSEKSSYRITVLVFLRVPQTVFFKFNISSKKNIYLRLTCFKQLNKLKSFLFVHKKRQKMIKSIEENSKSWILSKYSRWNAEESTWNVIFKFKKTSRVNFPVK
jgi:hypothetical protein